MENIPLEIRANMWFQQDGAPAHNATIEQHFLNENIKSKRMGTNKGPFKWSQLSPDLTPLNFFLWGHFKDI